MKRSATRSPYTRTIFPCIASRTPSRRARANMRDRIPASPTRPGSKAECRMQNAELGMEKGMMAELIEGEDFYWEGPLMVFTEAFLRKRGWCCESGCRHCPWKKGPSAAGDAPDPLPPKIKG